MPTEREALRVIVCGGRTYNDYEAVQNALSEIQPTLVITGGASGADALAERWAASAGVACAVFRPNWDYYGKAAGPIRNAWMLTQGKPDRVLAFPGGRGTDDMVRQAEKAGVPVHLGGAK